MESQLIWLFILSGTIFGAALIGGAIPFIRPWKETHLHYFISFGAGVLIGAAFIYMIPEATELISAQIGIAVLSGFLIFYFLERFVMIHPCLEGECEFHHVGWPAFLGFSLHNMVDGVALGASFLVPALTPAVFFALISHHVPTSFAFASILKAGQYSSQKILTLLGIFAFMVPLGAILSYATLGQWNQNGVGWAIGFSAGTFIHIATCDLLPEIHKLQETKYKNLAALILGLTIMATLFFFFHHEH